MLCKTTSHHSVARRGFHYGPEAETHLWLVQHLTSLHGVRGVDAQSVLTLCAKCATASSKVRRGLLAVCGRGGGPCGLQPDVQQVQLDNVPAAADEKEVAPVANPCPCGWYRARTHTHAHIDIDHSICGWYRARTHIYTYTCSEPEAGRPYRCVPMPGTIVRSHNRCAICGDQPRTMPVISPTNRLRLLTDFGQPVLTVKGARCCQQHLTAESGDLRRDLLDAADVYEGEEPDDDEDEEMEENSFYI